MAMIENEHTLDTTLVLYMQVGLVLGSQRCTDLGHT